VEQARGGGVARGGPLCSRGTARAVMGSMKTTEAAALKAMAADHEGSIHSGQGFRVAAVRALVDAGLCTFASREVVSRSLAFGLRPIVRIDWTATITDAGRVAA
jgi:hypothetical protein